MHRLDTRKRGSEMLEFEAGMNRRIIGQDEAVKSVSEVFQMYTAGLNTAGRPVGNLLFLGPTGSGKTRVVEALAEVLYRDTNAFLKVNCGEFQHSHEIAKIIGSPPGYLGHRETHPLITQESLGQYHTETMKLSLLLFDEIEKASDALWQLLLGVLDKAMLTLGDNRKVNLSGTMIFMTSNLGGREISEMGLGLGLGFNPVIEMQDKLDNKIDKTASNAARKRFSPEFMNRIDKTVVFHPLRREHLEKILDLELQKVSQRIIESPRARFIFRTTKAAQDFLLSEGTDDKYGARHLKRAIERHVVYPFSGLLSSNQINIGDVLSVDYNGEEMVFYREASMIA